ncbi:MAG: hypothetical protein ACYDA2_03745 [Acidimicrobiales bacterium]
MITAAALKTIASSQIARSMLDTPRTFVIVPIGAPAQVPDGWTVSRALSFASYAQLQNALASGAIPHGIDAILYDNEMWLHTPTAEQRDPALYMAMAAEAVHAKGLKFIAAPAVNLVNVGGAGTGSPYDRYIARGLPAAAAAHADIVDIQAQRAEGSTEQFASFVRNAVAQARAANPTATVLVGISTNPSGVTISASQLDAAAQAVVTLADGFWLNIPSPGPFCPGCGPARPDLALAVLATLTGKAG